MLHVLFCWISYLLTVNSGHWVEDVRPGARCAHDVSKLVVARDERVSNQRAVAPPGNRLGAHDGDRLRQNRRRKHCASRY